MFDDALFGASTCSRVGRCVPSLLLACLGACGAPAEPSVAPIAAPLAAAPQPTPLEPLPGIDAPLRERAEGERTLAPYFFVDGGDPAIEALPLERTHADVHISGAIADVTVTQVYRNAGQRPIEASYVFPASTRAAVHGLTMKIGERVIEAHIRERDAARREYESARATGHTASLLEQQRPNVFTMHVANVLPNDRIEVELRYAELLVPTDGVYELVYPTVVAPRYSNRREKAPSPRDPEGGGNIDTHDRFVRSPYLQPGAPAAHTFALDATIEAPVPVSALDCPSHPQAQLGRIAPRIARVTLAESDATADRDVRIRYRLGGEAIDSGLIVEPGPDGNHFLLMMAPPARLAPAAIVPREYVFVVDTSGSMDGFPLEVARRTMRRALERLGPQDRFDILTFSGGSELFAERSLPATEANRARGLAFLAGQNGGGGTELLPALRRVLALPRETKISRSIVVVTDGGIDVEKETFDLIRGSLDRANLFAVGVGNSVNRYLIEGMARAGQGEAFVATTAQEGEAVAEAFALYVHAPLLVGAKVRFEGFDAYDVEPSVLPDLFASRPIVVMGKYRGEATGRVVLTGAAAERTIEQSVEVAQAERSDGQGLSQLWARTRIARLGDDGGGHDDEVKQLGLAYHLMTAQTSFVAVDSQTRTTPGRPATVQQPSPMPEGTTGEAVAQPAGVLGLMRSSEGAHLAGIFGPNTAFGNDADGTVGLGDLGTIGKGGGSGIGYGRGGGGLGGRSAIAPSTVLGMPMVTGSVDREVIRRIVRRHMNEVRFVYEKALERAVGLAGTIRVQFSIAPNGKVVAAVIQSSTVGDASMEQELVAAIGRWEFPKPGASSIVVTYPFTFAPNP